MVIFHSYVKLPEGNSDCWMFLDFQVALWALAMTCGAAWRMANGLRARWVVECWRLQAGRNLWRNVADWIWIRVIYTKFIKILFLGFYHALSCLILFCCHFLGRKSDSACFNHLNVLCDCYQPQPCLSSEISTATCSCSFFLGGFDPAQGKTSKGRALDTCCRGCAKGGEHDVRCQQDAAP